MLPSAFRLVTFPASRTLKTSPTPRSKISSAGVRRVDAAQDDRQRVLPGGRCLHLPTEIAGQPSAGPEPFVTVLEDLQHLGRGQRLLKVAGRVVDVLDAVFELVLALEARSG